MKLYVCWGTGGNPEHHMCAKAYTALKAAGYDPEIIKVRSQGLLPGIVQTKGRKKLKKMTGSYHTPVLELDDGSVINPSENIVAWAKTHNKKIQLSK